MASAERVGRVALSVLEALRERGRAGTAERWTRSSSHRTSSR
ncbi:hypothetical protein ACWDBO_46075 [Streptomyces mirabilis]|nr:hypothetical protein [Streptomyces sp. AK02-04a]MDX3762988.1 hypothetical protein [Streptomyces sp. AK02-04a]